MDTKHTPGPWVVDDTGSSVHSIAKGLKKDRVHGYGYGDNGFICDLNDGEYHEHSDGLEQVANARLIASAPELLQCVIDAIPHGVSTDNKNIPDSQIIPVDMTIGEIRRMKAAFKKATQP